MMKFTGHTLLLSTLLLIVLFSCQNDGNRQKGAGAPPEEAPPLAPFSQGLINHAGQLPDVIDFEGQFLQAAQWAGQGSTFYTVVSKYEQGEFFSPNWASRLHIYLFEVGNEQILTRRAFTAEAPNTYSTAELLGDRSKIVNLPSMGTAFSIVYSICPDGEDPCSFYSNVVGVDGKYDLQVIENVDKAVYVEAQDAMMAGVPKDVRGHMLEQLFGKGG